MTPTDHLAADARWLTTALQPLHDSRLKGTPRPWKQPDLTPEQQARLDAQARQEKAANPANIGESPAPLHLDVLDLQQQITRTAQQTAHAIATALQHELHAVHYQRPNKTNPTTTLAYIAEHAQTAGTQTDLTQHANQLRHLRQQTARHFAEIVDGQRLKATCPWCNHDRLKFRLLGNPTAPEIIVRCEAPNCQPPAEDCGTYHKGRPCWPLHEWEWLAGRIDAHQRKQHTNKKPRKRYPQPLH